MYHPDYARLARTDPARAFAVSQPFSSRWADGLCDAAIDRRLDIVVEGLFKTQANTAALLDRLAASGYEVGLVAKIIPAPVSLLQIERRFERQMSGERNREAVPRRVDAAAHDVAYRALERLVALFENRGLGAGISLRDIDNVPLPPPANGVPWTSVVTSVRSQPLPDRERAFCMKVLDEVLRLRLDRGAPEDPETGSALESALALLAG
jgi:hypothetical protein